MRNMYLFDFSMVRPIQTKVMTDHPTTIPVMIHPVYLVMIVLSTHHEVPARKESIIQKCMMEPI